MEMNRPTQKSSGELAKIREEYKARKKRERGQRTTSRDRFRNRMGYDTGSNFSGPQLPPGQRQQNSASSRFRDRITPRDERGTPAQLERRRQTTQEGQVQTDASGSVIHKARYERLLRTSGPVIAKRYADTVGYVPPTGSRGGRGITRPFRERSGGGMGTMSFQQFMMMNQMQSRMQKQGYRGGVMYRATGGGVSGADTIPAMLTPGEFVMSAGAVRQHGVGAMRSLNKGQVPGFNRGGMVGGVAYRSAGSGNNAETVGSRSPSAFGINTEGLESFQQQFDNATKSLTSAITGLQEVGNFVFTHNFVVSGTLQIAGVNIDTTQIAQAFSEQFTKDVEAKIEQAFDNRSKNVQTPGQG